MADKDSCVCSKYSQYTLVLIMSAIDDIPVELFLMFFQRALLYVYFFFPYILTYNVCRGLPVLPMQV